ncbi:MAG: chorismate mutase [Candidatus Eremiobacteraeota bacterium]|nr:chorismate mutase [Candidatus Eremiobacteraeota bacterium]
MVRGIRGATTIQNNTKEEIIEAVEEMITEIFKLNDLKIKNISYILFSATPDITASFPASAVRLMGNPWNQLACLDFQQMQVGGSMEKVIRALVVTDTDKEMDEIVHVYLRDADRLRLDRLKNDGV